MEGALDTEAVKDVEGVEVAPAVLVLESEGVALDVPELLGEKELLVVDVDDPLLDGLIELDGKPPPSTLGDGEDDPEREANAEGSDPEDMVTDGEAEGEGDAEGNDPEDMVTDGEAEGEGDGDGMGEGDMGAPHGEQNHWAVVPASQFVKQLGFTTMFEQLDKKSGTVPTNELLPKVLVSHHLGHMTMMDGRRRGL